MNKPIRPKKCAGCGGVFQPERQFQKVCGIDCAYKVARVIGGKKRAAQYRADKKRMKSRADWLKEAQAAVNRYVRLRDAGQPCISCGTMKPDIQYAAGHYRTVKAASHLRFNPDNIHKQCNFYCNSSLSGNIAEYRPRLIARIGLERVEALECDNSIHKWTIDEARAVKAEFAAKIKELLK